MAEPTNSSMRFVILHGKDSFQIVERLQRFQKLLGEQFGEVSRFDFDGGSVQMVDVFDELRTFGLLATHKLIVVDKADQFVASEERRRALERYAEEPMEHATLVLRSESWRPGNLDKLVAKVGAVLKCEPPDAGHAMSWCSMRAEKAHGIELDGKAAEALVDRVGNDLARLDTEPISRRSLQASGTSRVNSFRCSPGRVAKRPRGRCKSLCSAVDQRTRCERCVNWSRFLRHPSS